MARTEAIGHRIGISSMGVDVAVEELRRDQANIERGLDLLKALADIEPEVRAMLARRQRGSWLRRLQKVAAI